MTDSDNDLTGWTVEVTGDADNPETETVVVVHHDRPRIRLEIHVPELASPEANQNDLARQAVQDAVTALQRALDSPSALPGRRRR